MPWQETSPMDLRSQFVGEFATGWFTMTELADAYRISRKTAYKWVRRHAQDGVSGLADRSRRPRRCPHATSTAVTKALLEARRQHPTWGAPKLIAWLQRHDPATSWPASSTVCALLRDAGLVRTRRPRRPVAARHPALSTPLAPNDLWTIDYKGEFRTGDACWCYPLTLRDGASRYVLRIDALVAPTYAATRQRLTRAFAEYGLPLSLRSDNGTPFASTGLGGLSRLAVWWLQLGIRLERILPGHPEQNGAHEQFHAVLKAQTTRPPARTASAQQRRFGRFRDEYNHERPHQALSQTPPAAYYTPSDRSLPRRVAPFDYAGHLEVRRVGSNGCILWSQHGIFLGRALAGHDVGFEEINDGLWAVQVGPQRIAHFDARTRHVSALPW
jgi:putative transposase